MNEYLAGVLTTGEPATAEPNVTFAKAVEFVIVTASTNLPEVNFTLEPSTTAVMLSRPNVAASSVIA